jgi:integrase
MPTRKLKPASRLEISGSEPFFADAVLTSSVNLKDLTDLERSRILDSVVGADRILLLLLFETSLEPQDLLGLKTSDLDLEKGELLLHSGQRARLSPMLQKELGDYLRSHPNLTYLLEGRCGKSMTVKWKRCVLEKLLSRAEIFRAKRQDQGLCSLPAQGRACSAQREV